ncbi:hypothetical protein LTR39_002517 [Cryomyces antarcticus]|nr:hypothetical protein LTR39_002517 [Cryomyces antarcticus]
MGIDSLWLPPGCKAGYLYGNGYDIYDLYDLGEFDQKGSVSTKWGTKEELLELGRRAEDAGIGLYWDAVLNHRAGADATERCAAVEVDQNDRTKVLTKPREIEAWLKYDFLGRGSKYSALKYRARHFSGVDYDAKANKSAIYKLEGKNWSESVDNEQSNDDYFICSNLDYSNPEVVEDVKNWGSWVVKEVPGLRGFRLDAVKHYSQTFTQQWVKHVKASCPDTDLFFVGEFWVNNTQKLVRFLSKMDPGFCLYDAPLLYNFSKISTALSAPPPLSSSKPRVTEHSHRVLRAISKLNGFVRSNQPETVDLSRVFENTLVEARPHNAVRQEHGIADSWSISEGTQTRYRLS